MVKKFTVRLILTSIGTLMFFFVLNFIIPIVPNKVYSLEKKAVYDKIIGVTGDYLLKETTYSKIFYTENDSEYIELMGDIIDLYYPIIINDFSLNAELAGKIDFIVFASDDAMCKAMNLTYENAPMGVYYGGVINILSPMKWIKDQGESGIKEKFLKEGPIVHEMIHFAMDLKANGNYKLWFTEGVALYYESKYINYSWRPDLYEASKEISINELTENFRKVEEGLAYRRSYDLVNDFVVENGEKKLQYIIEQLGKGKEFVFE